MDTENNNQEDKNKNSQSQQYVVFELDNEEYAVSILEVKEVIKFSEITPVPQSSPWLSGILNLRGKIIPVLDLEKYFHFSRKIKGAPQRILVIEGEQNVLFGILVDQVDEVLKVSPEFIKPAPKVVTNKVSTEFVKGVIVMAQPKDRILLILDLKKILNEKETQDLSKKLDSK